jgi:hypothetical protein
MCSLWRQQKCLRLNSYARSEALSFKQVRRRLRMAGSSWYREDGTRCQVLQVATMSTWRHVVHGFSRSGAAAPRREVKVAVVDGWWWYWWCSVTQRPCPRMQCSSACPKTTMLWSYITCVSAIVAAAWWTHRPRWLSSKLKHIEAIVRFKTQQ